MEIPLQVVARMEFQALLQRTEIPQQLVIQMGRVAQLPRMEAHLRRDALTEPLAARVPMEAPPLLELLVLQNHAPMGVSPVNAPLSVI
jgi:hypothetical protein